MSFKLWLQNRRYRQEIKFLNWQKQNASKFCSLVLVLVSVALFSLQSWSLITGEIPSGQHADQEVGRKHISSRWHFIILGWVARAQTHNKNTQEWQGTTLSFSLSSIIDMHVWLYSWGNNKCLPRLCDPTSPATKFWLWHSSRVYF